MPSITQDQIDETKAMNSFLILNGDPKDESVGFVTKQLEDVRAKTKKAALQKLNAEGFNYEDIVLKSVLLPDAETGKNRRLKVWVPVQP
jgi:hypothetical protein